jgi:hypothetical protein
MRIQFEMLTFSGIRVIINSLMPIVIEMDNDVRFASHRENYYKRKRTDINKVYLRMKLIIYTYEICIIAKLMLYLISSVLSLWEFIMFLFSYYKTKVLI